MENKILHLIFIFIIALIGIPCAAQSPDEIESMMDEIKLDESFIYGESYNENKDIAYQNALLELLSAINEIRGERDIAPLSASELQPIVKEYRYTRGTKNLSFLYLPLTQAMSVNPRATAGTVASDVASDDTAQNEQSRKIELKKQEEKSQLTFVPNKPTAPPAATVTGTREEILDVLCGQDNWVEIKGFIISFKNEGKITQTGNCLNPSEVPDDAYSILMDDMGGILSILSPKNSPNRINHKTNMTDDETNHANCKFIVWYK